VQSAARFIQNREPSAARDALNQAERLNSQQSGLWAAYGFLYAAQDQTNQAIGALQKEVEYHPENVFVYEGLAQAQKQTGRKEDAIQTLRLWVKAAPENSDAVLTLARELIAEERYSEAAEPLTAAVKTDAGNINLKTELLNVLLRSGKKAEASSLLAGLREQKLDAHAQNEIAYFLADTSTELPLAQELAEKSVAGYEDQSGQAKLSGVTTENLDTVLSLGAAWDTLGWVYFRNGNFTKAENFLQGAWILLQNAESADHLGQLYERQRKTPEAIHYYRLALAAQRDRPSTRQRLEKLGGSADDRPTLRRGQPGAPRTPPTVSPEEELSKMRSFPIPGLSQRQGDAEFFLLFSPKGLVDARPLDGDEKLKAALNILTKTSYGLSFPDEGPEKLVRRGILSCSQYTTPTCNLVLFLPANTRP